MRLCISLAEKLLALTYLLTVAAMFTWVPWQRGSGDGSLHWKYFAHSWVWRPPANVIMRIDAYQIAVELVAPTALFLAGLMLIGLLKKKVLVANQRQSGPRLSVHAGLQ